ncbi:anaphase-promoting complex subunit 10-like [Amblyomma americanum]
MADRNLRWQAAWEVSSFMPGRGVDRLHDDCVGTYWQSEGQLPHLVNIQLLRETTVRGVMIYTIYIEDFSYTPRRVSVRVGPTLQDLHEVHEAQLCAPMGWVYLPTEDSAGQPVRTSVVQLAVLSNHHCGENSRLRLAMLHC